MTQIARVKTVWSGWPGAPGISTHFFLKRTGLSWSTYANDMIQRCQAAFTDVVTLINEDCILTTQSEIDVIEDTTGLIQETVTGTQDAFTGTGTAQLLPLSSAICVTWRTSGVVNGKHVRGRTFLAPLDAIALEADGTPTASALALADAMGVTLIGTGGEAVVPTVWSRPIKSKTEPGEFLRFGSNHQITTATVKDTFAVLRSRRD